MQTVLDAGLSIPGDMSIVGHGDYYLCHALRIPLTTVHSPVQRMAKIAVEKLLSALAGELASHQR